MPRLLIIGYGNPLRGDDAVGWLAAERLQELVQSPVQDPEVSHTRIAVEVLAVHQLTPELMDPISRADRVIFMDAAADGDPGTIHRRKLMPAKVGQAAMAAASFTHQADPAALLAGARSLFGHAPQAWLVTVTGANFELTDELSVPVAKALDRLVAGLVHWVTRPAPVPQGKIELGKGPV